jgi:hypothetical protein
VCPMESNTKDAADACRSVGVIVKTVLRNVLKDRTLKGFLQFKMCTPYLGGLVPRLNWCEDAPYDAGLRST